MKRSELALIGLIAGCTPRAAPGCPEGMVQVPGREGAFCIQAYEARLVGEAGNKDQGAGFPDGSTTGRPVSAPGQEPSKAISWYQAYGACAAAGWHLCSSAEWEDACAGPPGTAQREYPTPDGALSLQQCVLGDKGVHLKAPLSPTGSRAQCHTPEGVYDLLGNLWEWTDPGQRDAAGLPLIDKRGAAHYSAEPQPCSYGSVGSHAPSFDGTIGFRCCAALP
ncbi:MAG: SUMF1/EgtB/PvdO family nonheme iron enzyme [Alphaproteobacteria bacterium]|nr:SUMF1/EgtB/PvdO family nonheme iron enzyme [Alphaproteobacteria bacterium]